MKEHSFEPLISNTRGQDNTLAGVILIVASIIVPYVTVFVAMALMRSNTRAGQGSIFYRWAFWISVFMCAAGMAAILTSIYLTHWQ